jgi:hypothetical protein
MAVYFRIHYNDDICSLLSVIALGKLGLCEGSLLGIHYNDDSCSLFPVIALGKLGMGKGSVLWNSIQ